MVSVSSIGTGRWAYSNVRQIAAFMTLLSIVIPTKNRAATAVSAVRAALDIGSDDLEVVVQDCSDEPGLDAAIAAHVSDQRLRYRYDPRPRSMTDNWNRAMMSASGEFICLVGDDDGVDARLVQVAAWARAHGVKAVNFPHSGFVWQGYPSRMQGKGLIHRCTGAVTWCNGERELRSCMSSRFLPIAGLAQIYHGLVHRDVFEAMHARTGTYFDGLAPDYYSAAMASALVKDAFVHVDYPLTMAGLSRASNSGRSLAGGLEKHLQEYDGIQWPEILPGPVAGRRVSLMVMAQSLLLALERSDLESLSRELDLPTLYALALLDSPRRLPQLASKLRAASLTVGRDPISDLSKVPLALLRLLRLFGTTDLTHAMPPQLLRWRGFSIFEATDVQDAVRQQRQRLAGLRIALPN